MAESVLRQELLKRIVDKLNEDGVGKSVSMPKSSMYIIDENGSKHKVVLKREDKVVPFNEKDVSEIISRLTDVVAECISDGRSVRLVNFGVFTMKKHKGHTIRDLQTKEIVHLNPTFKVKFIPGSRLKLAERLVEMAAEEDGSLFETAEDDGFEVDTDE